MDITTTNNSTIDGVGYTRKAIGYAKWFLKNFPDTKSILDVGCGDGIIQSILSENISFCGIDIGADIYKRNPSENILYIDNYTDLILHLEMTNKVDAVFLFDVLEHTEDFLTLFEMSMDKALKYVFVALPNEINLLALIEMLKGKTPPCHGTKSVGKKEGHRHRYLISIPEAEDTLTKSANKKLFEIKRKVHYIDRPKTLYKRINYNMITAFLPYRLYANGFGYVFARSM